MSSFGMPQFLFKSIEQHGGSSVLSTENSFAAETAFMYFFQKIWTKGEKSW